MCEKYGDDFILDYLQGGLPHIRLDRRECEEFEIHLADCDSCRTAVEELLPVARLSDAPGIEPRPEADSAMRELIAREAATRAVSAAAPAAPAEAASLPGRDRRTRRRRAGRWLRRLRRPTPVGLWWAAAAAGLMLAVGGYLYMSGSEEPVPGRVVARVLGADGGVFLRRGSRRIPAERGTAVSLGDAVQVPPVGSASLSYPDSTRLDLGSGTALRFVGGDAGKRIFLSWGALTAEVTGQPAGRPMVIATPHAEAKVTGTRFTLEVEVGSTRLEVTKGRVRLTRMGDGASVDVTAGHWATVKAGEALVARSLRETPAEPAAPAEEPAPIAPGEIAVLSFTLINADTGRPMEGFDPLPGGAVIDLARLPTRNLNIRANPSGGQIGCVLFGIDSNPNARVERAAPYSLRGDEGPDGYAAWTPSLGWHTVTATPYARLSSHGKRPAGEAGKARTVKFRVVDSGRR